MAFRRRRMRTRGRSRRQGSRWADAGGRGFAARSRTTWSRAYFFPDCGGLATWERSSSTDCWDASNVLLETGPIHEDKAESTIKAIRGHFVPWVQVLGATLNPAVTGVGVGIQLAAKRVTFGQTDNIVDFQIHVWDDVDNSDWLWRKWFFGLDTSSVVEDDTTRTFTPMRSTSEDAFEVKTTQRRVDWSEWGLFLTIAIASDEADGFVGIGEPGLLYNSQLRFLEEALPGAVG